MAREPDHDADYARRLAATRRDIAAIPGRLARGETTGDCEGPPPGADTPEPDRPPLRKLKRPPDADAR